MTSEYLAGAADRHQAHRAALARLEPHRRPGDDVEPLAVRGRPVEGESRIGFGAKGSFHPHEIFELLPVLKSMMGRRGGDLSGGRQQQLAIFRALVMRPHLLVLDEPTEGIQPTVIKDLGRAIRYLHDKGAMPSSWSRNTSISCASWRTTTSCSTGAAWFLGGDKADMVDQKVRVYMSM